MWKPSYQYKQKSYLSSSSHICLTKSTAESKLTMGLLFKAKNSKTLPSDLFFAIEKPLA